MQQIPNEGSKHVVQFTIRGHVVRADFARADAVAHVRSLGAEQLVAFGDDVRSTLVKPRADGARTLVELAADLCDAVDTMCPEQVANFAELREALEAVRGRVQKRKGGRR